MAKVVWTIPALVDVNEISEYISVENLDAAKRLVGRLFDRAEQLINHPESGSYPPELMDRSIRQIVESPCRIFYSYDGETVLILHVFRFERLIRASWFDDDE
jgi:plasmid stabilization system protein ParE